MKKILMILTVALTAAFSSFAGGEFEFVTDSSGYSYIRLNEDLVSFGFTVTDRPADSSFGVIYTDSDGNKTDMGKVNGGGTYSDLSKNGTISFYAGNLDELNYSVQPNADGTYRITFKGTQDANRGYSQGKHNGNGYGHNNGNGGKNGWGNGANMQDEKWMTIGGFTVSAAEKDIPTGMPLPGFNETILAMSSLLFSIFALQVALERRKK